MPSIKTLFDRGVKYLGNRLLLYLLPQRGRRAVFLTTLFVEIAKLSPEHENFLWELNKRFHLVDKDESLTFSVALHDFVWERRHVIVEDLGYPLTEDKLDKLCRDILDSAPQWSAYGTHEAVWEETRQVVREALQQRMMST